MLDAEQAIRYIKPKKNFNCTVQGIDQNPEAQGVGRYNLNIFPEIEIKAGFAEKNAF